MFDTTIRYSGVSLGYQAATVFAGAAAPLVGTEILRQTGSPALLIALLDACLLLTVFSMALHRRPATADCARRYGSCHELARRRIGKINAFFRQEEEY